MEARLRYIAMRSEHPEQLAEFYGEIFEMKELAATADGDVALTDGYYNLTIFKGDPDKEILGLSHFGIAVDDIHEVLECVERFASPQTRLVTENGDAFHGDYRIFDPNGIPVSLSTSNFGVSEPHDRTHLPAIRHLALSVPNQQLVLQFFQNIFGFHPQMTLTADGSKVRDKSGVADGVTGLQALIYPVTARIVPDYVLGPRYTQYGLNHFGWMVSDLQSLMDRLPENSVTQRPLTRPFAEYRGLDPEGNEFDLSETRPIAEYFEDGTKDAVWR